MKLLQFSCISLGCYLLTSQAIAQVHSDAIRQGTVLNASGIQLSSFGKPMPLPPGNWEVVLRMDSEVKVTGEGPSAAPKVDLVLRNTNVAEPNAAVMLAYTPETIQVTHAGMIASAPPA